MNVLQLSERGEFIPQEYMYPMHANVKLKTADHAQQLQQFWNWASAVVITNLDIAAELRMQNDLWRYGTYVPHASGWARSQLGASHFLNHGHRLLAFVFPVKHVITEIHADTAPARALYDEWQQFVKCYCSPHVRLKQVAPQINETSEAESA